MHSMSMAQSPSADSDEQLVAEARGGDDLAFARLVGRYRDVAFAYAYISLQHRDEAEDIVQEAFLRAFVSLSRLQTTRCFAAWLMQIVRNLCNDAGRRRRNYPSVPLDDSWPDGGPTPEMFLIETERAREVSKAVADLPEHLRVPLLMHHVSRRTYREIALALGIPETTVAGRIATALLRLRRLFHRKGNV